jgi:hypothetical protein
MPMTLLHAFLHESWRGETPMTSTSITLLALAVFFVMAYGVWHWMFVPLNSAVARNTVEGAPPPADFHLRADLAGVPSLQNVDVHLPSPSINPSEPSNAGAKGGVEIG